MRPTGCSARPRRTTRTSFGNPPVEAALHRRTVTVGDYPVAEELRAHGFDWFRTDDVESVRKVLESPGSAEVLATLDRNEQVARRDFSVEAMARALTEVLREAGWTP